MVFVLTVSLERTERQNMKESPPWGRFALALALAGCLASALPAQDEARRRVLDKEALERGSTEPIGPLVIKEISHVSHRLILFDEDGRRRGLPDGRYENQTGQALVIREGRIAELAVSTGGLALTAHATRIVDGHLSLYAEVSLPDGTYESPEGVWFRIVDSRLVELFLAKDGDGGDSQSTGDGE